MIPTVRKTLAERLPPLRGARVLVAASGGADSTALALVLGQLGCDVALAHVHHGIRGKSADADARWVAALSRTLDVPFFLGKFDVPAEAKARGESLEMAARRIRRDFLLETARRERIRFVATGHTADDQAETVLLRIVRGTSVAGLAGIPSRARHGGVTFIRPLIDVSREEVVAYLRARRQRWREDESNALDFAQRNRVRHEILPLLEKRLNPAVRQALLRLADIAAAENAVMSALAEKARRDGSRARPPLALRRRIALDELRRRGQRPDEIDFAAVEQRTAACRKKNVFHGMENGRKSFPWYGKRPKKFSMAWKIRNPPPGWRSGTGKGFRAGQTSFACRRRRWRAGTWCFAAGARATAWNRWAWSATRSFPTFSRIARCRAGNGIGRSWSSVAGRLPPWPAGGSAVGMP